MSTRKINRVIYRLWHNKSVKGKIGYVGKDSYYPSRLNLLVRSKDKNCRKLWAALKRYSTSLWQTEILASGFRSHSTLAKAEKLYIAKFDSKQKGYNCTDGGEGQSGWTPTKEARVNMSIAAKNKPKMSKETKKKMSEARVGNTNALGKHWRLDSESKKKMGKAQRSVWAGYSEAEKEKRTKAMSLGWKKRNERIDGIRRKIR